jgi:mannose-1-phosphate guanylyltransferase
LSSPVRLRALVLSAGLGMRLRPLTDEVPKPLLPVAGRPILEHTLRCLAAAGCEAVAVNLHHRGEQIRRHFGDQVEGLPITWSEEPVLLGTLGALQPLAAFFAPAEVGLLVNGDSLCDWPLAALVRHHLAAGAAATLLAAARPDPVAFGGGITLRRGGEVLALRSPSATPASDPAAAAPRWHAGGPRRRVFAGAHALSPALLAGIAAGFSAAGGAGYGTEATAADTGTRPLPGRFALPSDIVTDLYEPLLAASPGSLASLTTTRRWHDLGTPHRFLAATLDWIAAAGRSRWISPAAAVSGRAAVHNASIEAGCRVEAGARIDGSVLLAGAVVRQGCEVRDSLLGPGAELAAGANVLGQIVTRGATGELRS